jgi:4-amino-4-deoxy-L-arabinose transferase-like glycosyltransferase
VAQSAVRRLPRIALWLLCLAYVLPGFIGREPWRNNDMTTFGYIAALAHGASDWLQPQLLGQAPEIEALLPYWFGAWALQLAPGTWAADFVARIPFMVLLAMTLVCSWYAVYYLARSPRAQPVAFAFGGEARPTDYARAIADGGLLAMIACLGMAQLSHETTPAAAQLAFAALSFFALSAMPYHRALPAAGLAIGLTGLALSGAPTVGVLLGLGGAGVCALDRSEEHAHPEHHLRWAGFVLAVTACVALLAWGLGQWRWRIDLPEASWPSLRNLARLLLWFTWPVWPLAIWTLWRWRFQLSSHNMGRHLALPLWFVAVALAATLTTDSADRSLLLALPAMAALAAFALPTLSRTVSALVDWFTLLFFTVFALVIWVIWVAALTGVPRQPAANLARLLPGFMPAFAWLPFTLALLATLAWVWLVQWRVGRHRAAIWKSLVLPAGGTALCWLLLMTLGLTAVDFGRSYLPLVNNVNRVLRAKTPDHRLPNCVATSNLTRGQIAAFQFHGQLTLRPAADAKQCAWLLVDATTGRPATEKVDLTPWTLRLSVRRRADNGEAIRLYQRN